MCGSLTKQQPQWLQRRSLPRVRRTLLPQTRHHSRVTASPKQQPLQLGAETTEAEAKTGEEIGEQEVKTTTPPQTEVPHVAVKEDQPLNPGEEAKEVKAIQFTEDLDTHPSPHLNVAGPTGFMALRPDGVRTLSTARGRILLHLHNEKQTRSEFQI